MRNQIGIHYACFLGDWSNELPKYVTRAARLGFDAIAVSASDFARLSADRAKALKKLADDNNITLTYSLNIGPECNLTSPDEAVRKRGIRFVTAVLKSVAAVGGTLVSGITYGAVPDYPEHAYDCRPRAFENSVNSIKEIIKTAEDSGITYCVEPLNRFENYMLNTSEQAVELCKAVGSPNIKILLDSFHMNIEECDMAKAIETAGSYLAQLHLAENHRRPIGWGGLTDWDQFFDVLKKVSFEGDLTLEHFCIPGGSIGQDVRVTRDLMPDVSEEGMDREIAKALAFVKQKLDGR